MDIKKSIYITKLLRHNPEDLVMDKNGWVNVDSLLKKIGATIEELDNVIETNNKKRFIYNSDKTKIRANQGHSIPDIDVQLKRVDLPPHLFHGTAIKNIDSIKKSGIVKGKRLHVHLSLDEETALQVGGRHDRHNKPILIKVNAAAMRADNIPIYLSENGVYLTDFVDSKYLVI